MPEPITDIPEQNTPPLDQAASTIEATHSRRYMKAAALGVVALELTAVLAGSAEAKAEAPAEPITINIPAAENINDTQIVLTGPPWGDEAGAWGSLTAQGWYGLHVANEHMRRPGEIGASFLGAHSNLMNNGKIDVGGNLIDDVEFPKRYGIEDHALQVGDEAFIEMDDGTIVKQAVFDLREFIDEIPGLIYHLPNDQGVGIYTPKTGIWMNGVPEILQAFAEENGWAVTYLFTSYGGPNSDEWKEGAPGHRKYEGIIALRSTIYEKSPDGIDTDKDQLVIPTTDSDGNTSFDYYSPQETPEVRANESTAETSPTTADSSAIKSEISEAVHTRLSQSEQALAAQETEIAAAESSPESSSTDENLIAIAALAFTVTGAYFLSKQTQEREKSKTARKQK